MKLDKSDLASMHWSFLALLGTILLGSVILYGSNEYAAQTKKERNAAQARLNDARNQLATAQEDSKNMATYADQYAALERSGLLNDGGRLDWMEGLENLRRQHLVNAFSYSIAPQKKHVPSQPIDSGNFDIDYSEMGLELDLLHEGQLLNFFSALNKQVKGRYQLEGCSLTRLDSNEDSRATLKAECRGGWITLKNRNATP